MASVLAGRSLDVTVRKQTFTKDETVPLYGTEAFRWLVIPPGDRLVIETGVNNSGDINYKYTGPTSNVIVLTSDYENTLVTLSQTREAFLIDAVRDICHSCAAYTRGVNTFFKQGIPMCLIPLEDDIPVSWDFSEGAITVDADGQIVRESDGPCKYSDLKVGQILILNVTLWDVPDNYKLVIGEGSGRLNSAEEIDRFIATSSNMYWPYYEDAGLNWGLFVGVPIVGFVVLCGLIALAIACCCIHPFPCCCGCSCCCRPLKWQLPDVYKEQAPPLDL